MKKTVKCYLIFTPATGDFDVWTWKPSASGDHVLIDTTEVYFEVADDFDARPLQIKALQEKQLKAAAAFHAMNTEIMRQINELQALEMV